MSETSYLANRALGVAGPQTDTCFVQAFDRITPEAEVSPGTYREYNAVMKKWESYYLKSTNRANSHTARLYGLVAQDLGGYRLQDMVFETADKAKRIGRILDTLFDGNMRPVIDLNARDGSVHTVGVKREDQGLFRMVGYGVPAPIRDRPVTARDLEPFTRTYGILRRPHWPFVARNISALPTPEIKIPDVIPGLRMEKGKK